MNLTAYFTSLLKEWASRFKVPMAKLQISTQWNTEMSGGAYFERDQIISLNPLFTAAAREYKNVLRYMEHTLAHELGHHIIWSQYRRTASEHEANMIAKRLSGLTPREAQRLLESYVGFSPRGFAQRDMIEEEMERAKLEKTELERKGGKNGKTGL